MCGYKHFTSNEAIHFPGEGLRSARLMISVWRMGIERPKGATDGWN